MTDMIVAHQEIIDSVASPASLLHFHHGQVLRIGYDAVALYRDRSCVDDPLGNGVIGHELIPSALCPNFFAESGFVHEQKAGFISLHGGAVLFIRPDGIALYDDAQSALQNRHPHWLMPLSKTY